MNIRTIAIAGIFLVVVGSIFLIFGLWYAWVYGISTDIIQDFPIQEPPVGNLLGLISLSCSTVVLGIIFILWAYKLSKQSKNQLEYGAVRTFLLKFLGSLKEFL